MVEGGMSCIKYILFVFNFIFVLFGGLLVYHGVEIIRSQSQTISQIIEAPNTIAISIIILGFLIFLIAFLGCCGALIESHCILLTFGIIVTVILTLELTVAGIAFAFKADLRNASSVRLREAITKYNWTDPSTPFSRFIDQTQSTMRCCGVNSTNDWLDLNPNPVDRSLLPDSCCPRSSNHTNGPSLRETIFQTNPALEWNNPRQSGKCHAPGAAALGSSLPGGASAGSNNFDFDSGNSNAAGFAGRNSNDNYGSSSSSAAASSGGEAGKELAPFSANCADVLVDALLELIGPIGLICLAIAIFQLLGITFAFCLSKAVRREYQVV